MIDIGANLCHDSFGQDREAVLERARSAGVLAIVVTGSDRRSSRDAQALARAHSGYLFATAGIHPHRAGETDDEALAELRELAGADEVRAVGEMGLDFFRDFSPRDTQVEAFEAQLELAAGLAMPAFLHQRDAHDSFLPVMRAWRDRLPAAVVHCFTGTREELHDYLDLDLHIGLTGWFCDERRGRHLHELVEDIPADRLMIETDAPYLLPRDLKPKPSTRRNEPRHLPHIAEAIARARGEDTEAFVRQTTDNARRFFGIG